MISQNIFFKILFFITLMAFVSCETQDQKIEKAKNVVNSFLTNTSFDNYETMFELYPTFKDVKTYWKFKEFKIKSAVPSNDNIIIVGNSGNFEAMFEVQKKSGEYIIVKSKGLSSDYNSNLYKYCKKVGCIVGEESDVDISNICTQKKEEFNKIAYNIKRDIERNTIMVNQNIERNFGYVSGEITIKNNSRFTIPSSTYNLYIDFMDANKNVVLTKKELLNFNDITFGESWNVRIFETNSDNFRRVDVRLEIIDMNFIENLIGKHAEGIACSYSNNLD